ncbi:MAG TPA: hypothetical protein VNC50_14130 [Planctomycetia bacterium]|nr:hypothetical protein [Planctomycetia bacterium]
MTLATLLAVAGFGYLGSIFGAFTSACLLVCTLLAGLIAFNWFGPIADMLGPNQPAVGFLVMGFIFVASLAFLGLLCRFFVEGSVRLPRLTDLAGGAAFGAATGWLPLGVGLSAVRLLPAMNEGVIAIRAGREDADPATPDGYWLGLVKSASERGLAASPAHPFDPKADFLQKYRPGNR